MTWTANVDGNTDIYLHDLASGKTTSLPLPKGVNHLGGAESAFTRDGSRLLYYHNGPTSPNDVWVYSVADGKSQQITNSLVAGVQLRGHGRAVPGALSQPRRQVDDLRLRLRALQHGAQRAERGGGLCSRRARRRRA